MERPERKSRWSTVWTVVYVVSFVTAQLAGGWDEWRRSGYESRFILPLCLFLTLGCLGLAKLWLDFLDRRESRREEEAERARRAAAAG